MRNVLNLGSLTRRWVTLLSVVLLSGCANMYVDNGTKEISADQYRKPDPLHPVQALFEFQTKGLTNAQVTDFLKERVLDQVKSSGLFSKVSETPVEGGALLSITLNNVPITDDAFSKGFVTGLTFGLAGSQVTDGYICIARYSSDKSGETIEKRARHAIHTTIGNSAAPAHATKAADANDAIYTMTRQIVSNVLNDLSYDERFK